MNLIDTLIVWCSWALEASTGVVVHPKLIHPHYPTISFVSSRYLHRSRSLSLAPPIPNPRDQRPESRSRMGQGKRQVLESMYSVIALFFILVACVELCDAATVVDVYRLIQYDMSGAQFGSRLANLNHHAGSLHSAPGSDLSRTVLIIPLRELNISFVRGTLFFII